MDYKGICKYALGICQMLTLDFWALRAEARIPLSFLRLKLISAPLPPSAEYDHALKIIYCVFRLSSQTA